MDENINATHFVLNKILLSIALVKSHYLAWMAAMYV